MNNSTENVYNSQEANNEAQLRLQGILGEGYRALINFASNLDTRRL
jgi:hypothetical protein